MSGFTFSFYCSPHHTFPLLTLTHLAKVSSIDTCCVLVSFFFLTLPTLSVHNPPASHRDLALLPLFLLRLPYPLVLRAWLGSHDCPQGCSQRAQSKAFTAITGNGARQAEDVFQQHSSLAQRHNKTPSPVLSF